jgi:hypothetical protein
MSPRAREHDEAWGRGDHACMHTADACTQPAHAPPPSLSHAVSRPRVHHPASRAPRVRACTRVHSRVHAHSSSPPSATHHHPGPSSHGLAQLRADGVVASAGRGPRRNGLTARRGAHRTALGTQPFGAAAPPTLGLLHLHSMLPPSPRRHSAPNLGTAAATVDGTAAATVDAAPRGSLRDTSSRGTDVLIPLFSPPLVPDDVAGRADGHPHGGGVPRRFCPPQRHEHRREAAAVRHLPRPVRAKSSHPHPHRSPLTAHRSPLTLTLTAHRSPLTAHRSPSPSPSPPPHALTPPSDASL